MAPHDALSRFRSRRSTGLDGQDLDRCSMSNDGHTPPNIIQLHDDGGVEKNQSDHASEDGETRVEEKIPRDDALSGGEQRDGAALEAASFRGQSVESGRDPDLVGPDTLNVVTTCSSCNYRSPGMVLTIPKTPRTGPRNDVGWPRLLSRASLSFRQYLHLCLLPPYQRLPRT